MAEVSPKQNNGSILDLWKNLISLLRDTILLALGVLLLIFPTTFNGVLVSAGFDEVSIVGFKWKAKLVDSDQALKESRANATDLAAQNERLRL